MNIRYFLIFLICFFYSCNKSKKNIVSINNQPDSTSYYLKVSNKENISNSEKNKQLNKAYKFLKVQKPNVLNRNNLADITFLFFAQKEQNKFNEASKLLYKYSLESNDTINLGKAYRCRAIYYSNKHVLDSSFIYYSKAEKIYFKLKDKANYANILLNKGIIQYSIGDYLGAELSLSKAYNFFKEIENFEKIYGSLNQLGLVYNELKEYDKAIFYHKKALSILDKSELADKNYFIAVTLNNIGYLYIKQKSYYKATLNFELALKDKNIVEYNPDLYAYLIDNLAYCRFHSNNYKDLPNLFYEALTIREKLNNQLGIINSKIHISEYFQKRKDFKLAIKYSNDALKIAKLSKTPTNLVLALNHASTVDLKNASNYSKEYIKITDSLQIAERNSKDRFARISLETDEIIKKNDVLENKNRTLLYIFLVTSIIVLLLIVVRAQRTRTRELVYKQAQQNANEEIFNLMMSQQTIIDESRSKEKKRLAQDLHDGILGRMFGLRLSLDSINASNDNAAVQKRNSLLNELKIIEQDIREISHDLNREKLVLINNFVSIVHNLLEEQKALHTSSVNYIIDENINWDKVGNTTKINMFRILQEGLQNINKYANAKEIVVAIKGDDENVYLKIEDDGIGFDVSKKSKGIGMQNMISRTKESEGIIDINSIKNKGTKITITIPLKTKQIIDQEA